MSQRRDTLKTLGDRSTSILSLRLEANEVTASISQSSQPRDYPRNIVFVGETGAGKSSSINLIAGFGVAHTADDGKACTRVSARCETAIRNEGFNLWDTRGLGEGFFRSLFKRSSEGELKKFLRERHRQGEIDLLVYCIRGSRAHQSIVKNYNTFCTVTRRLAAPVVILVTNLEREKNMEDWWERNESNLRRLGMEFDGHACITALPDHPRATESRMTLYDLITRSYRWRAEGGGYYFGSPVQRGQKAPIPVVTGLKTGAHPGPALPHRNTTRSEGQSSPGTRTYDTVGRSHSARDSLVSQPSTPTSPSYHTAPRVQPTMPVEALGIHITPGASSISTDNPKDTVPSQPLSEETASTTY